MLIDSIALTDCSLVNKCRAPLGSVILRENNLMTAHINQRKTMIFSSLVEMISLEVPFAVSQCQMQNLDFPAVTYSDKHARTCRRPRQIEPY